MPLIIEFDPRAERDFKKIPLEVKEQIFDFIKNSLAKASTPKKLGLKMQGENNMWRYRIGDYRLICTFKKNVILILRVGHRREIYQH